MKENNNNNFTWLNFQGLLYVYSLSESLYNSDQHAAKQGLK